MSPELERLYRENPDAYEGEMKYYRDINNAINTARELGRQEGLREVRKERAQLMLKAGLTLEQIAYALDIPLEEVKKICM